MFEHRWVRNFATVPDLAKEGPTVKAHQLFDRVSQRLRRDSTLVSAAAPDLGVNFNHSD